MSHRTTVSIPLFEAGRWLPVVRANIERLSGHAEVVVSDAVGSDSSLDVLRAEVDDIPGVTFLGRRDVGGGWVPHCNDLLQRCTTELHMWLPQDDEIGPEWVLGAQRALDAAPAALLAVGPVERISVGAAGDERSEWFAEDARLLALHPDFRLPDLDERVDAGMRECLVGSSANLGLVFRGVVRREQTCLLPLEPASGAWVDILWALRMLTRGPFVPIEAAVYSKRWYAASTHRTWSDLTRDASFRESLLPEALCDLSPERAEATLRRAWTTEAGTLAESLATARTDYEESWSWRVTAPLRRVRARLRGGTSR